MNATPVHPLDTLFYPKNIAVVGASPGGGLTGGRRGGNAYIKGSIKMHFRGKIFPVHPTAENILGYTAYKNLHDIPAEIDLVIFSVPSKAVLEVMSDCAAKRVKYVHLFTAGFSETGRRELARLEKDIVEMARQAGIRVVGPNCMGLYCPDGGLAWAEEFPQRPGPLGFVSQSGQLASFFILMAAGKGLHFSKVVSYGNASDLQNHDFLEYLAQDEKTKYIGAYIEGLKDGQAFFEQVKKITREKPIVVYKGGLTEGGSRATRSHTASLAGSPLIWQSLCRQAGLIPVNSLEDMAATLAALKFLPLPRSRNAAILGGAGGGSVIMTDMAEEAGLRVPHLTNKTIEAIEEFVPIQGSSAKNPLDVMGAFFGPGAANLKRLMDLLRDDPNIDALIFNQSVDIIVRLLGRSLMNELVRLTVESMKRMGKPIYVVLDSGQGTLEGEILKREIEDHYNQAGLATFANFSQAARVLAKLDQYRRYLETREKAMMNFEP